MKQTGKRYTKEFKEWAVRLALSSDKSTSEVARELGVSDCILGIWKREALRNGDHPEKAKPKGLRVQYAVLEEENLRLKKELQDAREQRDILKKSLGILSQDPSQKGMS